MLLTKCNYHIYNKELLTIIKCLKNWRSEFEMTYNPFKVLTDNQTLKHFKTVKKLFFKQYCYFNLILNFNFYIKYCLERANVKADAFIKISDCIPDDENEKL